MFKRIVMSSRRIIQKTPVQPPGLNWVAAPFLLFREPTDISPAVIVRPCQAPEALFFKKITRSAVSLELLILHEVTVVPASPFCSIWLDFLKNNAPVICISKKDVVGFRA